MSMKRIVSGAIKFTRADGFASATRRFVSTALAALTVVVMSVSVSGGNVAAARPAASMTILTTAATVANEADVRRAMERAFQMMRAGEYGGIYDALPSASQRRVSREGFVAGMNRARGMFELDRLEISAVRVAGDLAVVDTVLYGRARRPVEGEGKIVSRQYMIREGGQWRVTTGDRSTITPVLAANRQLARRFPPIEPRVYMKRDGKWVDITTLAASMRRRQTK